MGQAGSKLHQLKPRQVLLPPQVLFECWPEGREEIVEVHDNMDEAVEYGARDTVATRNILHPEPPQDENGGVVVHVQKAKLPVVSLGDEEECVQHFDKL